MKTYQYLLPKLYAQKEKFFTQQSLREICEGEAPEKIAQILRDHGYDIPAGIRNLMELSAQLELAAEKRVEKILELAPTEAEEIIEIILSWEKISSVLLGIKIFESTGDLSRAISAMPKNEGELLRNLVEQTAFTLGSSPPQIKTVIQKIVSKKEIREALLQSLKSLEEGGGISTFQLALFLNIIELLNRKVSELNQIRKQEILDTLCYYIDEKILFLSVNAVRIDGSNRVTTSIIEKARGCRVRGKEILESIQSEGIAQLFSKIITQYGGTVEKGESPELQIVRSLRRQARRTASLRYASYPFTPALPLAVVLNIETEKSEIMKLLMELGSGISCIEAVEKASI
ncbi:MAG: V-type ATPase subunit [Fervidicoccaceae archaeon]